MKFGPVPTLASSGAILAHAVRHEALTLKKGHIISAADIAALEAAQVAEVVVAQLEPGDVGEDAAALRLAHHIAGPQVRVAAPFTGRANLFAEKAGLLRVDAGAIDAINAVDEAITTATLPPLRAVAADEMVGTVKIIPFAVPAALLQATLNAAAGHAIEVTPFQPTRVAVISTLLPGLKPSVIAKTLNVMIERLAPMGAKLVAEERVPHDMRVLAKAIRNFTPLCDMVVVFGASAITDRRDVIPAALEAAGGRIVHFGMPVDPGNLLLLGELDGKSVLGAPGCARSPKENGFDWVLQRLIARIPVTSQDLRRMGTGGLLMEIVQRPQPRLGHEQE
ncbi:molybdopterin-binding protein [Methylovirgula sp. 4M-Z18]|uniref:molybdopterin-binding protein n=1 Tax=Methylovirgula sp. 4M-Z18 TaxID=2293567 RepID=UPI001FE11853|nr:molybdopterin-binding protein [Methylovirgula sp. 4M-Z18]